MRKSDRPVCPKCGCATEVDPGQYAPLCFCTIAAPGDETDLDDIPVFTPRQVRGWTRESFVIGLLVGAALASLVLLWPNSNP